MLAWATCAFLAGNMLTVSGMLTQILVVTDPINIFCENDPINIISLVEDTVAW